MTPSLSSDAHRLWARCFCALPCVPLLQGTAHYGLSISTNHLLLSFLLHILCITRAAGITDRGAASLKASGIEAWHRSRGGEEVS